MGGCTIPGLRAHYFDCEICFDWYWCHEDDPQAKQEYPDCQVGFKIVQLGQKQYDQMWKSERAS